MLESGSYCVLNTCLLPGYEKLELDLIGVTVDPGIVVKTVAGKLLRMVVEETGF